jgi:hypothetical protein
MIRQIARWPARDFRESVPGVLPLLWLPILRPEGFRMASKKAKRMKGRIRLSRALGHGDNEGATPKSARDRERRRRVVLAAEEEHVLRCLGAAVLMQWNDLTPAIQRRLFESAISMGEPRYTDRLKGQIARFLHKYKNAGRKPH